MIWKKLKIKEILIYPIVSYVVLLIFFKLIGWSGVNKYDSVAVIFPLVLFLFTYFIYTRTDLLNSVIATIILWLMIFVSAPGLLYMFTTYGRMNQVDVIIIGIVISTFAGLIVGVIKKYVANKSIESESIYAKKHLIRILVATGIVGIIIVIGGLLDLRGILGAVGGILTIVLFLINPMDIWVMTLTRILGFYSMFPFDYRYIIVSIIALPLKFVYFFLLYTILRILIGNIKNNEGKHKVAMILIFIIVILLIIVFVLGSLFMAFAAAFGGP